MDFYITLKLQHYYHYFMVLDLNFMYFNKQNCIHIKYRFLICIPYKLYQQIIMFLLTFL